MDIIQTTSIELSEEEKTSITTIMDAYDTCACLDCFDCVECPLCVNDVCVGKMCKTIVERNFKKG